jgi:hypothetical protein
MKSARSHTAPTSCRALNTFQAMSFPVMNQLLCRGSSSNSKRTIQFSLLRSQKSSTASYMLTKLSYFFFTSFRPFKHFLFIVTKKLGNNS